MTSSSFFTLGQRLTNYSGLDVIVARSTSGGFGAVALGPDQAAGKWRALKMLRPDVLAQARAHGGAAAEQRLRRLFLREALTWVGLWPHPNLLTAQFVTQINAQLMLVLEYAEQGSLRDLFDAAQRQGGWLRTAAALLLAQQIAAGLLALHTPDPDLLRPAPIVHRDLKPENILLDQYGYALITDFGLAKAVAAAAAELGLAGLVTPELAGPGGPVAPVATGGRVSGGRTQAYQTQAGTALGTPAYMAPEQWVDASLAQEPADAYAFGVLLAELLTSRHPLLDLDLPHRMEDWRQAHTSGRPAPLRQLGAELLVAQAAALPSPQARVGYEASMTRVERLLARLLAKQADARPLIGEALAELQAAAGELGEPSYTPPDTYPRTPEHERIFWKGWADAYDSFKLSAEALPRIERALTLVPDHPRVLSSYGDILAHLNRSEEALTVYRRGLELTPVSERQRRNILFNQLGNLLSNMERYAEAEDVYAEQVAEMPEDASGWYNRANNQWVWARAVAKVEPLAPAAQTALGHAETGRTYATRAAALNPANPRYAAHVQALEELRAQLVALPQLAQALAQTPHDGALLRAYGDILAALKRVEEAEAAYRRALALIPASDGGARQQRAVLLNQLGNLLSNAGRYAAAEAVYAEAVTLAPGVAAVWYNRAGNQRRWAEAQAQAKQVAAARAQVEAGLTAIARAAALDPADADVPELAQALHELHDSL